jgi:photosystem II stability/assembly factor-like uncharacterized protein
LTTKAILLVCALPCILLGALGYLHVQLEDQYLPTGARLDAIHFENEDHGFVRACCPKPDEMFETLNGGRSWKRNDEPVPGMRRGRAYVDKLKGWSVVEDEWPHTSLYQTTDGGKTWNRVLKSETKGNFYFDAIQATSASHVWALGWESYHTVDGTNWSKLDLGYGSVDFLDSNNGWFLGSKVSRTADGGRTWQHFAIPTSFIPVNPNYYSFNDIYFINSTHGWIVAGINEGNLPSGKEHGLILTTNDGGENWNLLSHFEDRFLWSVFFLNENVGWVAGLDGTFLNTADGGKTWFDPKGGTFLKTADGGKTWFGPDQ